MMRTGSRGLFGWACPCWAGLQLSLGAKVAQSVLQRRTGGSVDKLYAAAVAAKLKLGARCLSSLDFSCA